MRHLTGNNRPTRHVTCSVFDLQAIRTGGASTLIRVSALMGCDILVSIFRCSRSTFVEAVVPVSSFVEACLLCECA